MLQWLEDRHPMLHAISFVDDVGLVVDCDCLEQGTKHLESIARDALQWGPDNKVELGVSKTEVLVFSRRSGVLRTAKDAAIRIGEQNFAIKQDATRWLGFWLDPKLCFKTHCENKMASAKGALQRVASLSRSNGGLSINLIRRVVVAASHICSVVRIRDLVERPAGPTKEPATVGKTKAASLGKHLTEADAASFGISMVGRNLLSNLSRTNHQRAEIVTKLALTGMRSTRH
jgi:hypothetical protein